MFCHESRLLFVAKLGDDVASWNTVLSWTRSAREQQVDRRYRKHGRHRTGEARTICNRKLSEEEQKQFEATVHESPEEVGFDAPAWTPALVQQYLDETSVPHKSASTNWR